MKRRIFFSLLAISLLTIALTAGVMLTVLRGEFTAEKKSELRYEAHYLAEAYELSGFEILAPAGRVNATRITLIAPDGRVLFDSSADAGSLENHADRPEFSAALINGDGEAVRPSDTLGEETFYYALKTSDGCVLRVSATLRSIAKLLDSTFSYIALIMLAVVLIAVIAARIITGRIVAPVNAIDPEHPLDFPAYDELSPLLVKMERQNRTISAQLNELSSNRREFDQITDQMSEALVIFGADRHILSANRSARRIFIGFYGVGTSYLELCRDLTYIRAMEKAFDGRGSEEKFFYAGRSYRLSVTPVAENVEFGNGIPLLEHKYAAVMFMSDITETEAAELSRREFTANVSHELKTPLTSILGYAEIMRGGIAAKEDFPRFIGMIYDEAKRLLCLIDDIIRLSKLDESGVHEEFKSVELYALSEKVEEELKSKAADCQVTLKLEGEPAAVEGSENLLHEMIYNLCDNAVSYNRPGGWVRLSVVHDGEDVVLSVSDNGIGISKENQSHVFERFFRVDKSRSKANGAGTGLGLSIVKHGARLHGATVSLESELDAGTEIKLRFKVKNGGFNR